MSIYYFNIKADTFDAEDLEGEDCSDVETARAEALVAAGELIRSELGRGELPRSGWIEIEDEHHRTVLRLPLRSAAS
jgi:hypothetical protein